MTKIKKILSDFEWKRTIAAGSEIRQLQELERLYGSGRWRKMKGVAMVETQHGEICRAEIHWYEAHGIGKRRIKLKTRL